MSYKLNIVDTDPSKDLYWDRMDRVDFGTYQMYRTRFVEECKTLFPDFGVPYLVFKENLIRIENYGGLSPLVEIGNGTPVQEILSHLDKMLSWRDFASQKELRNIVNVYDNNCNSLFEEMIKRGDSLERKFLP